MILKALDVFIEYQLNIFLSSNLKHPDSIFFPLICLFLEFAFSIFIYFFLLFSIFKANLMLNLIFNFSEKIKLFEYMYFLKLKHDYLTEEL
jgi:hypothetical protein